MTEKSKLPDLQELSSMTRKLFQGIKKSVEEIVSDYKAKRAGHSKPKRSYNKSQTKTSATKATRKKDEPKE